MRKRRYIAVLDDTGTSLAALAIALVLGPAGALAAVAWFAWVTLRLLAGG